jgi:hypothetical protein
VTLQHFVAVAAAADGALCSRGRELQQLLVCLEARWALRPPEGSVLQWQQQQSFLRQDELGEDEVRQLLFDLESSHNEFISTIR